MNFTLGDDSDIARGFQLESFRLPPNEDSADTTPIRFGPSSDYRLVGNLKSSNIESADMLFKPQESVQSSPSDNDETLVTMFISKEAAVQFAGADKHFPGRPPTARPRGAPPPRSARSSRAKSTRRDLTATLPARTNNRDQLSGSRSNSTRGGKSPLLMAQLPPRKQPSSTWASNHGPVTSAHNGLSNLCSLTRVAISNPALSDAAHPDSREACSHDSTDHLRPPRPFAWGELKQGNSSMP